ncbi:serine hydrolase domain-containing protein [Dictyobacter aurantiacus]|uniref:6-aminohexanoate-dimer hydrolase n=1 Tax=Dictyobacter aurantiacus TaxID=1936993 RepID=A0A401ZJ77_9CHLR|nr:serine hydrolase [Dictyobacter aurantiacus]GCE06906.1 6-aminohexanoate-dimer hydrolase [Dictyobacter aurantiacus]
MDKQQVTGSWPNLAWKTATPNELSADIERLKQLDEHARRTPALLSIIVVRSGIIIFEEYYHGWGPNHYHNVNSVTKSVTSALVGIALREGHLQSVDQPLLSFFPEYHARRPDPSKQEITLRHLLTMTSGYALAPGGIETFLEDTSSIERMLDRPLEYEPGTHYAYDDIGAHLVALVLTRCTGMPLHTFARRHLFDPLGIWQDEERHRDPWQNNQASAEAPHRYGTWSSQQTGLWSNDAQGHQIGGFGLQLTTREMARFGYLYLNQGIWNEQRILPAEYIEESWRGHSRTERGEKYGYFWFLPDYHGRRTSCAVGYGGQLIGIIPELDIVVASTCAFEQEAISNRFIIKDFVIPAMQIRPDIDPIL